MKRRLPIGIQDFTKIREGGYTYVDKTAHIHRLISGSEGAFFLSRPRRFGKSLLCSTLEAVFEGKRELFTGLDLDSLEWEWKKHPVIRLDLNAGVYSNGVEGFHSVVRSELQAQAEQFEIELEKTDSISQFKYLIRKAHNKTGQKAVVIIDEYDKPMLNTIDEPEIHKQIRAELKGFYGVLKSYDEYLKFVFLTGVTKFSHVSIFSDLNHLTDLTLDPRYADICGITQEELEHCFIPEIASILERTEKDRAEYLDELRRFYNGYRFSEKPLKVYNPFGLLKHFNSDGKFSSYWYETGTPTFLVKLIAAQKLNIVNLGNLQVGDRDFRKFDIETMRAEPLLYQSGYLTVKDHDEESNLYTLDFPNIEVRSCFANSLLEQYLQTSDETAGGLNTCLLQALLKGNVEEAIHALRRFFAVIPYDIIRDTENYYQTAVHLIFTMLGFNCRSEVRIASGRIDTLVETKNFVYCFEFKLNGSAKEALAQIDTKEYLLPWEGSGKKLFKVGIRFDQEKRNIGEWEARES
ncbi:MAG: ATP-binding protein [Treponema sp.]|nr:ATP-binding protein [Treponema sp.]